MVGGGWGTPERIGDPSSCDGGLTLFLPRGGPLRPETRPGVWSALSHHHDSSSSSLTWLSGVPHPSPRGCPAGSETVFHCRGRSVGTSRPEGAPCSDSQKNAVPAGSAGQNSVYPAGRPARRDPRGCLRREREPALRALSSCVLRHTTHTPCALSAFEEEETEAEKD